MTDHDASGLSEDNLVESDCSINASFDSTSDQKMNLSCLTAKFVQLFFTLRPINNALSLDEAQGIRIFRLELLLWSISRFLERVLMEHVESKFS